VSLPAATRMATSSGTSTLNGPALMVWVDGSCEHPGPRGDEKGRGQEGAQATLAPAGAWNSVKDFLGHEVEHAEPSH